MTVPRAIALVATALWIAVAALHLRELWPAMAGLDGGEVPAFLASQSAELAFFWLVLGFIWLVTSHLQQRADSRHKSLLIDGITEQLSAVSRKLETESRKFEDYQHERIRAAQPLWEIQGCIAHKEQHEINIRNTGAAASSIRALWPAELPLVVALSNPVLVDRGDQLTLKVMFRDAPMDKFDVTLEYHDALRETRKAYIAVSDASVAICHEEC